MTKEIDLSFHTSWMKRESHGNAIGRRGVMGGGAGWGDSARRVCQAPSRPLSLWRQGSPSSRVGVLRPAPEAVFPVPAASQSHSA